jgi:RNA polymerase sigma factor (sigma-70 family)
MNAALTDAELVAHARSGDRGAFGQLVERYQGMVSAFTYARAGDLGLSEDLAQETFLAAWKGLRGLADPLHLAAWLRGIARNLAANAHRASSRTPVEPLPEPLDVPAAGASPLARVLAKEEDELLWRALSEIPETYREPLILFYREGQSVERVARALEISSDAAKQRLARGRLMLKEQVAAFVETALTRSRPGAAFTVAVLAALPALAPEIALAAGGAASSAASPALPAAGNAAAAATSAGLLGAVAGSVGGLAGAWIGARASIEGTATPRERRFMVRATMWAILYALAFVALQGLAVFLFVSQTRSVPRPFSFGMLFEFWSGWLLVALTIAYTGGLVALIVWTNRRQRRIRVEDGSPVPGPVTPQQRRRQIAFAVVIALYVVAFLALEGPARDLLGGSPWTEAVILGLYLGGLVQLIFWGARGDEAQLSAPRQQALPTASSRALYTSVGGGLFGSVFWTLPLCVLTRDWLTGAAIVGGSLLIFVLTVRACRREPTAYFRIAQREMLSVGGLLLVAVHLRWESWMAAYRTSAIYDSRSDLPRWAIELLLLGVVLWVLARFRRLDRRSRGADGTRS